MGTPAEFGSSRPNGPAASPGGCARARPDSSPDAPERGPAQPQAAEATLLEGIPSAVFALDEAGRITYLNGRAEQFFGLLSNRTRQQLLGKVIWEECPEIGDSTLSRDCAQARAEQRALEGETYYPSLGRWLALHISPAGSHLCVSLQDITERTKLERALRQRAEELVEVDRGKDEFLTQLAHEVRNALAPILNALHLAQAGSGAALGGEGEQALHLAGQEVRRLSRLMDDLQKVSRFLPGKVLLRKERVNLAAVVCRALTAALGSAVAKGHNLVLRLPAEPVYLEADPKQLELVLPHLLENALKFTRPGGDIRLTVERGGAWAVLRVQDTGVGMAPELVPHVFDLFMRPGGALGHRQGVGVGLTIVRRLVELHGGTVDAHSAGPGLGSEFVVRLPALPEAPARAPPDSSEGGGPLKVLVVDDDIDLARSTSLLLKSWGYDVRAAYDGPGALTAVREQRPDVVLLDIAMPGMDGYQVARQLRQGPGHVVLAALTGYGEEEDRAESQEAGFDYHLVKPVDPADLKDLLALAAPSRAGSRAAVEGGDG